LAHRQRRREQKALLGLIKFDEKTTSKDEHEKKANQPTTGLKKRGLETQFPYEEKYSQIQKRFIDLDRVARKGLASICGMAKDNSPRNSSWCAENFLIDEVSNAYKEAGQSCRDRDQVEKAHPI
jgi:hypothetical protein